MDALTKHVCGDDHPLAHGVQHRSIVSHTAQRRWLLVVEVFRHATNEPKLSQITDFRAFHAAKVRHGGTEKQASVALKDLRDLVFQRDVGSRGKLPRLGQVCYVIHDDVWAERCDLVCGHGPGIQQHLPTTPQLHGGHQNVQFC